MSDEANYDPQNFFVNMATHASVIPVALFLGYNFPYRFKRKDKDQSEEDIWEEEKENEERKGVN